MGWHQSPTLIGDFGGETGQDEDDEGKDIL